MKRRALVMLGLAAAVGAPAWVLRQRYWARSVDARAPNPDAWRGLVLPDLDGRAQPVVGSAPFNIVNLWARWCAPCRRELPALQRLAARWSSSGPTLVTVALDDEVFALREYVRDIGFRLPVLLARSAALPPTIRPQSLPQTLVIDRAGSMRRRVIGARDWDQRDAALELLAGIPA